MDLSALPILLERAGIASPDQVEQLVADIAKLQDAAGEEFLKPGGPGRSVEEILGD